MKKKIFVCGGHVTPALALIDELRRDPDITVVYIGRTYAVERELAAGKGMRFLPLTAGKKSWSTIAKIPVGFVQAFIHCLNEKPDLVVSFGGYVALPIAVAAWVLRIPVITHEQTLSAGYANNIIAKIAKRVCVTFEETLVHFPGGKAVWTGLPIRKEIFSPPAAPAYDIDGHYPLIYITGGSQGARSLNEKIAPAIPELTKMYTVIHQTGSHEIHSSTRYITESYISAPKLSWILHKATIIVGRSGANTTVELAALGKVAILVPLPWSAGNEQLSLARWLESHGAAVVIEQRDLDGAALVGHINKIRNNYEELTQRAARFSREIRRDGALRLAREVLNLL